MTEYTAVYSKKMVEINIVSYFRKNATTFEKQDYDEEEEEEDEEEEKKRNPKYINYHQKKGWIIDRGDGKLYKVKFYYTHWCDTYEGRTYITVKR